jgi:hypothetical protein
MKNSCFETLEELSAPRSNHFKTLMEGKASDPPNKTHMVYLPKDGGPSRSRLTMIDQMERSIIIHYKDGNIQTGLLQCDSLTGKTIRYLPQSPMTDRRRVPRVSFIKEVTVDQLVVRRIVDLSTHGMYVETLIPYPLKTVLPISLSYSHETIELDARVVFNDPGVGMGLEFEGLTPALHHKLEALVQHSLNRKDNRSMQDRRLKGDRRTQKHPEGDDYRGRNLRKKDRRQHQDPSAGPPVEVELSRLKSILFLDQDKGSKPKARISPVTEKEVIVVFRDGEEVRGTLSGISPEKIGFFMDLPVGEKISHSLYVIKTAVESILYV